MLNENNLDQRVPPTQDTPYEHATPLIEKELNPELNADYLLAAEEVKKLKKEHAAKHDKNVIESNLGMVDVYIKLKKPETALELIDAMVALLRNDHFTPDVRVNLLTQFAMQYNKLGEKDKWKETLAYAESLQNEMDGDTAYQAAQSDRIEKLQYGTMTVEEKSQTNIDNLKDKLIESTIARNREQAGLPPQDFGELARARAREAVGKDDVVPMDSGDMQQAA